MLLRALPLFALALLPSLAFGDAVVLKNGNTIYGTVEQDTRDKDGTLILRVGDFGTMTLRAGEILAVKSGDEPEATPAVAREVVEVKLKTGTGFYGEGSYFGQVVSTDDDGTLVLNIPEAGRITIPRAAVESIKGISESLVSVAPVAFRETATDILGALESIDTTHKITLKNGETIRGDVLETALEEPVKIRVGDYGIMLLPRRSVERIDAEAGKIILPPAPAADDGDNGTDGDVEKTETQPLSADEIKNELLREILEQLIDERIGAILGKANGTVIASAADEVPGATILEIQDLIRDLSRQRSQNRVRAERKLTAMGPIVLPYLQPLTQHPFELTRRAVHRIVRSLGAIEGAPIAIDGLVDPDRFVREIAHETLRTLLPNQSVAYNPNDNPRKRARVQAEYWNIWDALLIEDAKQRAMEEVRGRF